MPLVTPTSPASFTARRSVWTGVAASLLALTITAGGATGAFAATSGSQLDQSFEPASDGYLHVGADYSYAQTFTSNIDGLLSDIEVSVANTSHMSGDAYFSIRNVDADGVPTGPALASVTLPPFATLGWTTVTFAEPVPVQHGKKYAFEASGESVASSHGEEYGYTHSSYGLSIAAPNYNGGELHRIQTDGSSVADGSFELLFRTYVVAHSAPAAPTDVTVVAGDGTATVTWTAPANNGGAITSYTATASTGEHCVTETTSCTVEGLTNGTEYTFTVTASNAFGISPASAQSAAVVPAQEASAPVDSEPTAEVIDTVSEVTASGAPELAKTGADSAGTATLAALLLGGGLAMLLVARRRKQLA